MFFFINIKLLVQKNNLIYFFTPLLSYFNISYTSFFFVKNNSYTNKNFSYFNIKDLKKLDYFFLEKNNFKNLINYKLLNNNLYKN
jgi:hypothetical protein